MYACFAEFCKFSLEYLCLKNEPLVAKFSFDTVEKSFLKRQFCFDFASLAILLNWCQVMNTVSVDNLGCKCHLMIFSVCFP